MEQSPYVSAIQVIRDEVYGNPSEGFRARLIILLTLTALYTFLLALVSVFIVESLGRAGGGGLWLWRKGTIVVTSADGAEEKSRTLTIFNIKLIVVPLVVVEGVYNLAWLANEYQIHIQNASARYHFAICSLLPLPIALAGYVFSVGTLTATTFIIPEETQPKYARAINWINSYGSVFSIILVLGGALFQSIAGTRYYYAYEVLRSFLENAQESYRGGPLTTGQLAEFDRQEMIFARARNLYRTALTFQWSTMPIYIVALIIINFFSLRLSKALKAHLEESKRNLGLSIMTTYPGNFAIDTIPLHELDLPASSYDKHPRASDEQDEEEVLRSTRPSGSDWRVETSVPSMGNIRKLARSRRLKDSAHVKREANRILELNKTRSELQVMSLAFVLLALGALAITGFLAVGTGMFLITQGKWPIYEALWFCYAWGNCICLPPIGFLYSYIQIKSWWIWRSRNDDPSVVEIEQVVQEHSELQSFR